MNREKSIQLSQQLSDMLQKTLENNQCNEDCVKRKELRAAYDNSTAGYETLEENRKNFISFTKGSEFYNQQLENKINQAAIKKAHQLQSIFHQRLENIRTLIEAYTAFLSDANFGKPLVSNLNIENKLLVDKLANTRYKVNTYERKGFYVDEQIEKNKKRTKFTMVLFYILAIIWTAYSAFHYKTFINNNKLKWILQTILIWLYPFYIHWIVRIVKVIANNLWFYLSGSATNIFHF